LRTRARDVLIIRIVDVAVERRRMESTLLGDPVIMHHALLRPPRTIPGR
jgi:hypothetical protein